MVSFLLPFREGRFKILFTYGMDDIASNLYFLSEVQNGIDAAKKKLTKISLFGIERKMATWIKYIEQDSQEEDLRQEVWKVWKTLYKSEERKPRKW